MRRIAARRRKWRGKRKIGAKENAATIMQAEGKLLAQIFRIPMESPGNAFASPGDALKRTGGLEKV